MSLTISHQKSDDDLASVFVARSLLCPESLGKQCGGGGVATTRAPPLIPIVWRCNATYSHLPYHTSLQVEQGVGGIMRIGREDLLTGFCNLSVRSRMS